MARESDASGNSVGRKIIVFDTTLRDGEQSPGCAMNVSEKVEFARALEWLGVDVIEAGFAASSNEDFESVKKIAQVVTNPNTSVACLARLSKEDISCAWEAVRFAAKPRIHVFIATSDIHLRHKLKLTREQVLERITAMVSFAKSLTCDIEFSAEDASRSDADFLKQAVFNAVKAGATTINLPDTVGYAQPQEFGEMVREVCAMNELRREGRENVVVSVHCHDDLGLAVANSLEGVRNGAGQVECTINGVGERAGNAALEEVVMNLRARNEFFNARTGIDSTKLFGASQLLTQITSMAVQRNKAVVGANAFAHEAGIHQHGMIANRNTYEIMSPEDVGWVNEGIIIGKHSGRHGVNFVLEKQGIKLSD